MSNSLSATRPAHSRWAEVDLLKGVAIIGVLVIHSSFEARLAEDWMVIQAFLARVFDWSVIAFFFSSALTTQSRNEFSDWFRSRLILVGSFFFYQLVYNATFFVLGRESGIGVGKGFWGWINQSPAFQLYFLPYLFVISAFFQLLWWVGWRHSSVPWVAFVICASFFVCSGAPSRTHGAGLEMIFLYTCSYALGSILRQFPRSWVPRVKWWLFPVILVVLLAYSFAWHPLIVVLIPPCILALVGFAPRNFFSRWLGGVGIASGSIYLWHTPLLMPVLSRFFLRPEFSSWIGYPALFLATIVICLAVRKLVSKVFPGKKSRWLTL